MKLPRIQICAGAGCKAWDSEKLACELNRIQEWGDTADYEIQLVPCMKNYGGGISVKSKECKLMVSKYRTTEEALDQLESHVLKLKLAT
jgi:PP-loop superfamily ATP-utilizing enzyme